MYSISINDDIQIVANGFCLFIAVLTLGGYVFSKFKPCNAATMFNKRMITLWCIIALFAISFLSNIVVALSFFAVISFLALREFFDLCNKKYSVMSEVFAYFLIPIQYIIIFLGNIKLFYIFVPLLSVILVPIVKLITLKEDENYAQSCTILSLGLLLCVYLTGYMGVYLLIETAGKFNGVALLLFILILTLMNDFLQTVFGQLFGKTKIVPHVSPNKTWVGLFGGIASSIYLCLLMGKYLTPFDNQQLIVLGIVLSIAGFLGDVTVSAIKRDVGVKDSGTLLPGHGGILDRLDSLFFTMPLFFHIVLYFFSV